MKKVSITEAKNGLSALIDGLKGGSPVLIVDRGRPVARLEPVPTGIDEQDGRIDRLVREGVVRAPRKPLSPSLLSGELPRVKGDGSVVAALLEERRDGR
ncbi:MAG: type II toxin-antitoxin system Phd/YefM family antitoxin [Xanthobacteraceae bacterium]